MLVKITNAAAPQPPLKATVQPLPAARAAANTAAATTVAKARRRPASPWRSVFIGFKHACGGGRHLTLAAAVALVGMMELVSVPPFERFYEEHKRPVLFVEPLEGGNAHELH